MDMLDLTASIEMTAKANALQWFAYIIRAEENSVLNWTLRFCEKEERMPEKHMERKSYGQLQESGLQEVLNPNFRPCNFELKKK